MINLSKDEILSWLKKSLMDNEDCAEPNIVCAGIGGGGCNIVSELSRKSKNVKHYCLNTDFISNAKRSDLSQVNVGMDYILDNRDSGGYPEIGRKVFKEDGDLINYSVFSDADLIILVAALGGGTGSGGIIELVRMIKKSNTPFRVYVVRPFEFEDNRKSVADATLVQLKLETDQIEIFDNNEFQSIQEANKTIRDEIDSFISSKLFFLKGEYRNQIESMLKEELDEVMEEKELDIEIEVEPTVSETVRPP
ncbi:MAG: hypothetical protein QW364_03910 [Thermoplasmatales archaeon]